MTRVPVGFGPRDPSARRRPARKLAGLLLAQGTALALTAVYLVSGGDLKPDHGFEQLGLLNLSERVEGLDGTGRAAIVVAPGTGRQCLAKITEASRRRDRAKGVPTSYDVVVLAPRNVVGFGLIARPDPLGAITQALRLERALAGCNPGYAVIAPDGTVRYRTYDDDWQRHGGEQHTLLSAVDDQS